MKGKVFAYGPPCPKCGKKWDVIKDMVTGDVTNILCKDCFTMPVRFGVDGRPFRNGRGSAGLIYRDKRGELLYYFQAAQEIVIAMRTEWRDKGQDGFDPTKYTSQGRKAISLKVCVKEYELLLPGTRPKDKPISDYYLSSYRVAFYNHILPIMGDDKSIKEITAADIMRLRATLIEQGFGQNSIKTYLSKLRTLLKHYCERENVLDKVPAFPRGWGSSPHKEQSVVDAAMQRKVWSLMDPDLHLLMETYCALGCRPSEAVALKRGDLMPDGRIKIQRTLTQKLKVGPPKNGRSRMSVPGAVSADLHARLCALQVFPNAWLFTFRGELIRPNVLSRLFKKAAVKAGHPNFELYAFSKHSMATITAREAEAAGIAAAAGRVGVTRAVADAHYIQRGEVVPIGKEE